MAEHSELTPPMSPSPSDAASTTWFTPESKSSKILEGEKRSPRSPRDSLPQFVPLSQLREVEKVYEERLRVQKQIHSAQTQKLVEDIETLYRSKIERLVTSNRNMSSVARENNKLRNTLSRVLKNMAMSGVDGGSDAESAYEHREVSRSPVPASPENQHAAPAALRAASVLEVLAETGSADDQRMLKKHANLLRRTSILDPQSVVTQGVIESVKREITQDAETWRKTKTLSTHRHFQGETRWLPGKEADSTGTDGFESNDDEDNNVAANMRVSSKDAEIGDTDSPPPNARTNVSWSAKNDVMIESGLSRDVSGRMDKENAQANTPRDVGTSVKTTGWVLNMSQWVQRCVGHR